jgi:hypothetical protein
VGDSKYRVRVGAGGAEISLGIVFPSNPASLRHAR